MPMLRAAKRLGAVLFLAAFLAGCQSREDALAELRTERDQLAEDLEKARAEIEKLAEEKRQALDQANDYRRQIVTANGAKKLVEDENHKLRGRLAAPLVHVAVFQLKSADDADELIADVHDSLGRLPGVRHYWVGTPVKKSAPPEGVSFHVGVVMLFDSEETLKTFLEDRSRQDFVKKHQPRVEKLQVFDVSYAAPK